MDYKELAEQLNRKGLANGSSIGYHSGLYEISATAIIELIERVKRAEDKLERYECAEKDGRLFIAPCNPGDLIYQVRDKNHAKGAGISPRRVGSFTVFNNGKYEVNHSGMKPCPGNELNETWFLSINET